MLKRFCSDWPLCLGRTSSCLFYMTTQTVTKPTSDGISAKPCQLPLHVCSEFFLMVLSWFAQNLFFIQDCAFITSVQPISRIKVSTKNSFEKANSILWGQRHIFYVEYRALKSLSHFLHCGLSLPQRNQNELFFFLNKMIEKVHWISNLIISIPAKRPFMQAASW